MSSEWTRKPPQERGYYWFVDVSKFNNPNIKPTVVHVKGQDGQRPDYFEVDFLKQLNSNKLKETIGCWFGTIPIPEYSGCTH